MQLNKPLRFVSDSWREVRKVVWPTPAETLHTGLAVFGFVAALAALLWATDRGLEWLIYDVLLRWTR